MAVSEVGSFPVFETKFRELLFARRNNKDDFLSVHAPQVMKLLKERYNGKYEGVIYTAELKRTKDGFIELYINGELIWWCEEERDDHVEKSSST